MEFHAGLGRDGPQANASTEGPDDGAIDYTPKPALVVPPKMDLPPPQASTSTPADWPHDPDATARAKAEADSRRPAPSSDSSSDNSSGDFVADADKAKPDNANGESEACTNEAGKPICFYGPSGLMNFAKGWNMGGLFQSHPEDTSKLRIGSEPPREYLIQPPPGYQMPKVKDEDSDAAADATRRNTIRSMSVRRAITIITAATIPARQIRPSAVLIRE